LRGGPGSEYDVSLKTGASVLQELSKEHYDPLDIFIDKEGQWHLRGMPIPPERAALQADVIFNALHGEYGEGGTVQKLLDATGVPYTGSGALASAIGMNKALTKERLKDTGIKLPRQRLLSVSDSLESEVLDIFRTFPQPSVVKPVSAGSSVGVTIARSFQELWHGVKKAFEHSSKVLVEEFIRGKEATAGVVEGFRGKDLYALLPIEIVPPPDRPFFDYEAKYGGGTLERVPGNFSKEETQELQRLAALVHKELGLKHYSRSDFIVSPRGIYFLEVNTLPGLTNESLIPKSLRAAGASLSDFLHHIVQLAHTKK
jgi:D-alanine-D-alanine ligase